MSVGRDTSFNLAAALAPILVTLVVTPFYLHIIGSDRFGILAICWTIVGALGFASLGMGPALTYRLALIDEDAPLARSNHVWMALLISFAASFLGALVVLAIAGAYFQRFVLLPSELKSELWTALPFLAVLLPLGTLSGVLNGAIQGRRRFGALGAIGILNAVVATTAPLVAALTVGVELPILIFAMVSANALVFLMQFATCARIVPLQLPSRLGKEEMSGLLGYGAWMSATALIAPFLLLIDRFVIGGLRGPTAVTVYVLAFNLLQGQLLVPSSLSRAMLPRLAPIGSEEEVQLMQSSSLLWLNGILTPASIVAIAVAAPFFHLWIGATLGKIASPVAVVLLVGGWVHGIGHIPSTIVAGRSRPDLVTKLLIVGLLPYLLLLYFATARFGVIGAAAAWTIRAAFDPVLFLYTRASRSDMRPVAISAALVLCAMAAAVALTWTSPLYWGVMTLIFAAGCYQHRAVLISSFGHLHRAAFRTS
jgi:O-antigen/teichoic acid export membrane protein